MRRFLIMFTVLLSIGVLMAELGSNIPTDNQLLTTRMLEGGSADSGIFDIAVPPPGTPMRPVERVPRDKFGIVGPFPLTLQDLDALVYPDATAEERQAVLEGMTFFTTAHTAAEGLGPMNNQPFCLGCHMSSADAISSPGIVSSSSCVPGSTCVSLVSRAARSTPTNFKFTALDPATGGGQPAGTLLPDGHPNPADNLDAINGPGRTAAFTTFGDFNPNHADAASNPTGIGFFDPLDGAATNIATGMKSQAFGGFVQHTRPAGTDCAAKPIPPVDFDANLQGTADPVTGLDSSTGFRRSVGERAGPPYIGRGLMEAVPTADILANADPNDTQGHNSSLGNFAASMGCTSDCISGKANMIPRTLAVHTDANGNLTSVTGFVGGVGRFGLRANGVEILQFIIGGLQGELGLTSLINGNEINFPTLFPATGPTTESTLCLSAVSHSPEVHLSTPFSERHFIRNTAPPEFGDTLLDLLKSGNPASHRSTQSKKGKVQRGAELFGIDLVAFANRMVPDRMPKRGNDGLDPNAINQADRKLNCVGCHTPVQRTGQSPASVGAAHLSFVWAPIFSDLLLHKMPVIDAERFSPRPRDPLVVTRQASSDEDGRVFNSYDLPRNLADDTFSNLKASADGREFRTAPLMGLGRMGPPFLHDARVYLSTLTVDSTPASTVTTNSRITNKPLIVRTVDDAIRAAIELHDLPAPDDENTPDDLVGAGCPVPTQGGSSNVSYGAAPQDVVCPTFDSATSKSHRSDAREVIRRFRALSPEDQQAVIEFLKQL
ncbi:MAG TPA: di-heme oxidoredictase family protein [Terriglobales bacterium]|nr:di-heme oxidoredictase family protein [Terriglobales bacterium]